MATSWPTWDCHRSARVTYRLVVGRGERYPEWLQRSAARWASKSEGARGVPWNRTWPRDGPCRENPGA